MLVVFLVCFLISFFFLPLIYFEENGMMHYGKENGSIVLTVRTEGSSGIWTQLLCPLFGNYLRLFWEMKNYFVKLNICTFDIGIHLFKICKLLR